VKLPKQRTSRPAENTIALINIVFLMLIFFLVAGTLAPPLDSKIALIETEEAERAAPPEALSVAADRTLRYRGTETTLEAYLAEERPEASPEDKTPLKLVVDKNLPAVELMTLTGELRALGVESVTVVTERAGR
jgi:biopolymer transport protein ExbD